MEIVSIKNEAELLTATLSRRLILIRLTRIALFCVLCLSASVFVLLSSRTTPLLSLMVAQPLVLLLFLPTILLLIFAIQMVFVFWSGQSFSFDRRSDSIRYNSRRVAALSDLKEVQVRRPTFSTWKRPRTLLGSQLETTAPISDELRSMPEDLRLWEWPSIWLIFDNRRATQLLSTTDLMPIRAWRLNVNFASQQQVEKDVVTVATKIADYAGVTLYDETAVVR